MPRNVANNPIKRREHIQKYCGLPDGQVTLFGSQKEDIIKKENEMLREKENDDTDAEERT